MKVLVTGAAGFVGCEVALRLAARGDEVVGIDNLNGYYDVALKEARLKRLEGTPGFRFQRLDIADREATAALFAAERFERVVHLAAQAGVRHGVEHPHDYADANLVGFLDILEGCRRSEVAHLVYASSSSVYGGNTKMPFSVDDNVDHPLSLYAATKKANELMAHSYAHLYALPVTGLRFFTVYGPWGRPDMSPFIFAKAIAEGRPIQVFNHGRHQRDFTYIDDIAEGVVRCLDRPAAPDPAFDPKAPHAGTSAAPYRIYNIGNNRPVELLHFISCLEAALGRKAEMVMLPMQPGDVVATYADIDALARDIGYRPSVGIEEGVNRFIAWYRDFYRV